MRPLAALALALVAALAGGCHEFTVVNGKPAMPEPAAGYDDKLHSAVVGDVVVIDKPVALDAVCPQGWAKIERRVTFVDGLIDMLASVTAVGGVYKADSLTVHCANGAASAPSEPAAALHPPRTAM